MGRLEDKMAPVLAAALLALLTAGCTVAAGYSAAAPGAKSYGDVITNGTEFHFERQGVIVGATVSADSVRIAFEVPEGKVVKLLDKTVEISVAEHVAATGALKGWEAAGIFLDRDISPDAPMTGRKAKKNRDARVSQFWDCASDNNFFCFVTQVNMPESGSFTLKMPRFSVNGVAMELPPIAITEERDIDWEAIRAVAELFSGYSGGW